MGKKMVIFVIALLLLAVSLAMPSRTYSQTQDIKIVNWSWYIDPEGYLDVVGLVQNVGPNTISQIQLTGSVIGPGEADLDDSGTQVWVSDLLPQQEAPFYMEFVSPQVSSSTSSSWYDIIEGGDLSSFLLSPVEANATSSYQYQGLAITSSKGSIGTTGGYNGAYEASGVIKNTGDQSATNLTVVAAFFNSTGTVVGVGFTTWLTPTVLTPGNTTTFQVYALDLNQSVVPAALQIKSYQLLVQCEDPILQGAAPVVVPVATGSTAPTASPGPGSTSSSSSSSSGSHVSFKISSILTIVIGVVIAVVVASAAFVFVRQVMSRRPRTTVKQARKTKKQNG